MARRALVVAPRFVARSSVLAALGSHAEAHPLGIGEYIAADATGLTEVPGVWVAGNVTDLEGPGGHGGGWRRDGRRAAVNADLDRRGHPRGPSPRTGSDSAAPRTIEHASTARAS